MSATDLFSRTTDLLVARHVYSEPITDDGTAVIPAATVRAFGGGGDGSEGPDKHGEGGGFVLAAQPVGAVVIREGTVRWRPAIVATRIIAGIQVVAVAAFGFRWLTERARARSAAAIARLEPSGRAGRR